MVRRIENASKITDLNNSYFMETPQDKVIKNIDEIKDLNNSYIMEFPEEQKLQEKIKHNKKRKKHDIRLSKITKKDVLNNANKIKKQEKKEKQNGFLPPDVAAMQADVEFIRQQLQEEKQANKKNTRKNRPNISIPLSFYGQPMVPINNKTATISKRHINNQKAKKKGNTR